MCSKVQGLCEDFGAHGGADHSFGFGLRDRAWSFTTVSDGFCEWSFILLIDINLVSRDPLRGSLIALCASGSVRSVNNLSLGLLVITVMITELDVAFQQARCGVDNNGLFQIQTTHGRQGLCSRRRGMPR